MKISIILPLFDRRNAGWRSLESAIGQAFLRDAYEVVAVTGRELDVGAESAAVNAMLAQCDAVVRTDLDTSDVASEIRLFQAGYERSTGELLLFMEGHTELTKTCCAVIDAYFRRHPASAIAWAPRINHAESALGTLISMHNLRHERRAAAHGTFSLGANSVVRRDLFERSVGSTPAISDFSRPQFSSARKAKELRSGESANLWRRITTTCKSACGATS